MSEEKNWYIEFFLHENPESTGIYVFVFKDKVKNKNPEASQTFP